jgi:hypothetical protein
MCRIFLITLLFVLLFVGESSANGSVCKIHPGREIRSGTIYNIENCTNTEIDLGAESARAPLTEVKAFGNQVSKISDDTFKSAKQLTSI